MAEKKYLSVYGKGATEVVGRILPVWKNENRSDKDFGHMTTIPPSQKEEHWSCHLALQDLTGGLNYIGPYPDRHSMSVSPADLLKAINEKAAEFMLQISRNNELVVLNHITGEKPNLKRLSQITVLSPTIEKQLEFGEKELKVIKRSEPGKNNMETRWEWNEDVISKESAHVLPPGIRAVVPADDPIIPIITTKANMEGRKIRIEGINPLDWKKESFWLKDVKDPVAELKLLQTSPGAIRMFRPRKYFRDCLCEANIVHGIRPDYTQHVKDQNLLKKKYKEAVAVCSNIIKKKNNFCVTKNDYDNLCQIGVTLFQDDDFRQTLKADAEVLKFFKADEEDIRLLETLTSTVEDVVSGKRKPLSGSETITLLNNLNSIMEHPELKGFRPGELNTKILEPLGPEYFISGRCIALLEALREYGGGFMSCRQVDKSPGLANGRRHL